MPLNDALTRIIEARHHDPFEVLGRLDTKKETTIRLFLPDAVNATLVDIDQPLNRIEGTDLFEWRGKNKQLPARYQVSWTDRQGALHTSHDPYCFPAQLKDFDLHLISEGKHHHAYRILGAHPCVVDEIPGTLFAVWAPCAERVSVIGYFNHWDGRTHPMRIRGSSGI